MLNPADIKRVFPFTLTDNGLPYEQPHELNIVNVMRKVGIILGESNTDLLLSMEKTACGVDEHTVNTASLKKPANVSASKHLGSLPMKPKSIRGMALPAGNSKATKSCAKVTKALAPPAQRNKSKRVAETEPPVDNHTAKSFKKAKPHSDIQTLHATKQNTFLRSESALSAMTNVELAQLCDRFSIDVPLKSKKSILVQALLNYRDDGARHHREKIESRSEHVFAFSDDEPTVAIVTSTKATKADVNHIFREEAKEFTKSLLNDIKNMKSFNKPIDVTAEPEHDELIRTKATLMEMVEQKKASKEMFQEHLDMFTKVTAIAKEPLLECIKIHSQQMVSLSSNLHVPHQQYLQQAIAPPPFSSSYNQQTVPQATNPPAALISSQQYTPYQQYFVQEQLNSNMPHPWHQTQQQNMMVIIK